MDRYWARLELKINRNISRRDTVCKFDQNVTRFVKNTIVTVNYPVTLYRSVFRRTE